MVLEGHRVYPANAFAIAAHPDTAVQTFGDSHHYRREMVFEVLDTLCVIVVAVHAIFIGAYPDALLAVHHYTHHAGRANDVTCAQLMAHVVEAFEVDGLHKDTFLQQTEPEVTALVFGDRVNLTDREVNLE